jgi:hypothetical protein
MWQTFIVVYLSYLILGPHWVTKFLNGKKLDIVSSPGQLLRRSIFISYVALLFTAWFLYKPSMTSFVSALIMTITAAIGFYIKYGTEPIPMHLLLIGFIIFKGREYMNPQLWLTMGLVLFYTLTHEKIYIG